MTNEVTVVELEVSTLTPAYIEAPNLDDLVANVDQMLAKYREFPVVDETYDKAKELRAEVNAGIKNISDQRKKIEKEVLGNWPEIKSKMMAIEKSGKAVSDLMKDQMVPIENERREQRRAVVMNDVAAIANENDIDWARIQFNEKWLNKTYSRNDMIDEINAQISQLKKDDELLALQTEQIEVEASGLGLDPTPYLSMLGMRDFGDIKAQMHRDNEIKKAREEARLAAEKARQEAAEKAEQARLEKAQQVGDKMIDENGEVISQPKQPEVVAPAPQKTTFYIITAKTAQENAYIKQVLEANQVPYQVKEK